MKHAYTPFHTRSCYSFLRGVLTPEEICLWALKQGCRQVVMTDINGFHGAPRFLLAAREAGLRGVIGTEIQRKGIRHVTLFPENREGFARINQIVTRTLEAERLEQQGAEAGFIRSWFSLSDPAQYCPVQDLAAGGWSGIRVIIHREEDAQILAASGHFPNAKEQLFYALYWGLPYRKRVQLAGALGIKPAALNTAVWDTPEQRNTLQLLRAIDQNILVQEAAVPPEYFRFASPDQIRSFFSAVPGALSQSEKIAAEGWAEILPDKIIFPGFQGLSETSAFHRLQHMCRRGINRRYGESFPELEKRLRYELSVISKKGFAGYFLVVHDIVSRCPRTCGRGSSASSIVSYLLGITHVDPLKYNLFFERFLNMGRVDPPDIDVDFPWDEREKALAYVFEAYPGSSGMVADHVTFGPRSALRDPAKALGYEEEEQSRLVSLWLRGDRDKIPEQLRTIYYRLRGLPRNMGTHPGGVIITPGPVHHYTHLQTSPMGIPVIAWEKDGTEEAGLVKIDLLGNRSLGVLRDTITLVNRRLKEEPLPSSPGQWTPASGQISWESFQPLQDRGTSSLIREGHTLGVFYVESPATRQLLRKMDSGSYEHLVIASSIIRPAANRYINEFVARLRGKPFTPLLPVLGETLQETKGIMVYQEDVSRVAMAVCGFSPAEADKLRKVLSKKDKEKSIRIFQAEFYNRGKARNIPLQVLEDLWLGILSFDGYSFCKAHSASYALVSYRLAWMKRYFPLEFLVSVINNGGGFYSRQVYLNAVRREGFKILLSDINRSEWAYTTERLSGETALRVGFCQLKDLSRSFLEGVLKERSASGSFTGFFDLLDRVKPGLPELRVLIRSGTLDSIMDPYCRPQLFWVFYHRRSLDGLFDFPAPPEAITDYPEMVKVQDEIETLGLVASRHPLALFRSRVGETAAAAGPPLVNSAALEESGGMRICIAGTLVCGKEVFTRRKKPMSFVSFEDEAGFFETVLFPQQYNRLVDLLDSYSAFLVCGRVQIDFGAATIEVDNLFPLERVHRGDSPGIPKNVPAHMHY